jgi:uncharacterized protein with von Willebrand factor type A (vWA) domain
LCHGPQKSAYGILEGSFWGNGGTDCFREDLQTYRTADQWYDQRHILHRQQIGEGCILRYGGYLRTFLFCSNLGEATHIFESYPLEEAIARIETGCGFRVTMGLTDYGRALLDFKEHHFNRVSSRTTVFIIGDARNNYDDPGAEILGLILQRCRKIVWLNPESPPLRQTGDSVMKSYLTCCHVARECNTLNHLGQVAELLCHTTH